MNQSKNQPSQYQRLVTSSNNLSRRCQWTCSPLCQRYHQAHAFTKNNSLLHKSPLHNRKITGSSLVTYQHRSSTLLSIFIDHKHALIRMLLSAPSKSNHEHSCHIVLPFISNDFQTLAISIVYLQSSLRGHGWTRTIKRLIMKQSIEIIKIILISRECINSLLIIAFSNLVNLVHIIKELTSFIPSSRSSHQGVHNIKEFMGLYRLHQQWVYIIIIINELISSMSLHHQHESTSLSLSPYHQ